MATIPHIVPLGWKALLITRQEDAETVINSSQVHQAQIYLGRIDLEEKDLVTLYRLTQDQQDEKDEVQLSSCELRTNDTGARSHALPYGSGILLHFPGPI